MYRYKKTGRQKRRPEVVQPLIYCRRRRCPEEGNSRPARSAHTTIKVNISQGTKVHAIMKIKTPQINTPNIIAFILFLNVIY